MGQEETSKPLILPVALSITIKARVFFALSKLS